MHLEIDCFLPAGHSITWRSVSSQLQEVPMKPSNSEINLATRPYGSIFGHIRGAVGRKIGRERISDRLLGL